ncbi:MAG: Spy/CpxP family protein refolding chaperone [Acidobacteria bacterium]|nr:Spy/CpxP family protein refolding chaperone [Acidobacteriota bacterium]
MTRNGTATHRNMILAALMVAAVLAPVFLFAGPGRGGGFGHHGRHGGPGFPGLRGLDLSEAQRTQIHEIFSAQREQGEAAREQLHQARQALADQIHAETFDEVAIRQAAQQVSALEENQAVERARLFQQIRQILTPEQLQQLETMKQDRREWRQERRDHGPWGGPDDDPAGE